MTQHIFNASPYFADTELPKGSSSNSDEQLTESSENAKNNMEIATADIRSGASSPNLTMETGSSSPDFTKNCDKSPEMDRITTTVSKSPISSLKTIKMANPSSLLSQLQASPFL